MLKKAVAAAALVMALIVAVEVRQTSAQESAGAKAAPGATEPSRSYRADFSVNEIEDGKKVNSRQYSMNLTAGDHNDIQIGTRVPFEQKPGEFTYLDVGTSLSCRLRDRADLAGLGNDVLLNVRSEISNFAAPEQQGQNVRPLLRQMKIEASTVAQLGKPMVVGSVDDPNSKRQFQLEVTVTKLK
jgi:hypothetical protein